MAYLNKAIIMGNLTRDPEVKALPSGMHVTNFSLATNRSYKDKEGNKQEDAEFHNIVVFGKQADSCGQYLKKGQEALVEGRIQTRSWEGEDGKKNYRTEIVGESVTFGRKGDSDQTSPSDNVSQAKPVESDEEIDIPFK